MNGAPDQELKSPGLPLWVTNGSQRRPRECRLSVVKRKQSAIKQTLGLLVSAGVLDTPFGKFARLQVLTIEDLFAGVKPAMPPEDPAAFKRAAREEEKTLKLL